MITDAGFEVEGTDTTTLPGHRAAGGGCGSVCGDGDGDGGCASGAPAEAAAAPAAEPGARTDLVAVRRRGAGTDLAPNA
jgi:biotin synthase